jgi:hypothetical protein
MEPTMFPRTKNHDASTLARLPMPPVATLTLFPEYAIAALGTALLGLPLLQVAGFDCIVTWPSICAGGISAFLALAALLRVSDWQIWTQVVLGFVVAFAPAFVSIDHYDWTSLLVGLLIIPLAGLQMDFLNLARARAEHLGWRASSPVSGRGPRLVYSAGDR